MPIFAAILEKLDLDPPLFYGISDRHYFPDLEPLSYLELLFQTPAQMLQWREEEINPELNRYAIEMGAELARHTGKLFLVNSLAQAALEAGCSGVHLKSNQQISPVLGMREKCGRDSDFLVGKSAHTVKEAVEAERDGADYVLLGPIFDPLSKQKQSEPLGLSALREAAQMLYIPVFALGGVEEHTLADLNRTNAMGFAGITWLRREVEKLLGKQTAS
ncbi:MAG: thiamine phosphate synthase [Acidobacteria bacterium]|nr:thiamine phosphate synthase [Acidobacteriota bacterium]